MQNDLTKPIGQPRAAERWLRGSGWHDHWSKAAQGKLQRLLLHRRVSIPFTGDRVLVVHPFLQIRLAGGGWRTSVIHCHLSTQPFVTSSHLFCNLTYKTQLSTRSSSSPPRFTMISNYSRNSGKTLGFSALAVRSTSSRRATLALDASVHLRDNVTELLSGVAKALLQRDKLLQTCGSYWLIPIPSV
jgi:hypothetical protein